jgi:SAM-dependent methyltransferase
VTEFDRLIGEALAAPFEGWDFSYLDDRTEIESTPWNYKRLVEALAANARTLLDMGTGGGEFLSRVRPLPPATVATEAWMPNALVAARRLRSIRAYVVAVEAAPDNASQTADTVDGRLPFGADTFDVVINRHEAYLPAEVERVLRPGCTFLTQQVGAQNERELRAAFDAPQPYADLDLDECVTQLTSAGLTVHTADEAFTTKRYLDVGAIVYQLRAIPWEVPDFSPDTHRAELLRLHRRITSEGAFEVREHRLLLRAKKP